MCVAKSLFQILLLLWKTDIVWCRLAAYPDRACTHSLTTKTRRMLKTQWESSTVKKLAVVPLTLVS